MKLNFVIASLIVSLLIGAIFLFVSIPFGRSQTAFNLNDSTTFYSNNNTCVAKNLGMEILISPCKVQDADGIDIQQDVIFKWTGAQTRNISWVFVYDSDLEKGRIELKKNVDYDTIGNVNIYVNNYLVDNIVSYTNLTYIPQFCNLGNTNNTQFYNVTRAYPNATQYVQTACFTTRSLVNATAFRISGNAFVQGNITLSEDRYVDVTDKINVARNLIEGKRTYYTNSIQFNPDEIKETKWYYTPINKSKSGKWEILGYETSYGLLNSIQDSRYLYIDPWWDASWNFKQNVSNLSGNIISLKVDKSANMNADYSDLRFLNPAENMEYPYYIVYKNTTQAIVEVQTNNSNSLQMYYGNAGASTTGSLTLFGPSLKGAWFFEDKDNITIDSTNASNSFTTAANVQWINNRNTSFGAVQSTSAGATMSGNYEASPAEFSIIGSADINSTVSSSQTPWSFGDVSYSSKQLHNYASTLYWTIGMGSSNAEVTTPTTTGLQIYATNGKAGTGLFLYKNAGTPVSASLTSIGNSLNSLQIFSHKGSESMRGVIDDVLYFNLYKNASDVAWLTYRNAPYAVYGAETPNAPSFVYQNITFNSQSPSDVSTTNVLNNILNITYNFTIGDAGSWDWTTVRLYHKVNTSANDCMNLVNGTYEFCGYQIANKAFNNTLNQSFFSLFDNDVYPGIYNYNETISEGIVKSNATLAGANDIIKVNYIGFDYKLYNAFEFYAENQTATSSPLNIYYCNSTYSTGALTTSTNCALIGSQLPSGIYNHTENFSRHFLIPFVVNLTSGSVKNIKITNTSTIALQMVANTGSWFVKYITNTMRPNAAQTSSNNGNTYSNLAGTPDAHLHQFNGTATLYYFASGQNLSNFQVNTSVRNDLLDLGGLPPSTPGLFKPVNGTYLANETLNITWLASSSPNGYRIIQYNISLLNLDGSYNKSIIGNLSTNLSYQWDVTGTAQGSYLVGVKATDNSSQVSSYGLSGNVTIANIVYPLLYNYSDNNASVVNSGTATFNVTVVNSNGTVILNFDGINYAATNYSLTQYNASVPIISGGDYTYSWLAWGNGMVPFSNASSSKDYFVNGTRLIGSCGGIATPGVYRVAANLTSGSNCFEITGSDIILDGDTNSIIGNGANYSIKIGLGSGSARYSNVTVRNFGNLSNFSNGVYIIGDKKTPPLSSDVYLDRLHIENMSTAGIYDYNGNGVLGLNITNTNILGSATGIYLGSPNDVTGVRIENVSIYNCTIGVDIFSEGNIMNNLSIYSPETGIFSEGSSNSNQFYNISIYNSAADGIDVNSDSNIFDTVNITGDIGVDLASGTTISYNILRNFFINSTQEGINMLSGTEPRSTIIINPNIYSSNSILSIDHGTSNYLIFNNSLGEISFTNPSFLLQLNVAGVLTFPGTIKIGNNSVYLNSTYYTGQRINSSANIVLKGIRTNFVNPVIMKDDNQICTDCYNFTSLNAGTVSFNVTSWSNYSIGESAYIINYTGSVGSGEANNITITFSNPALSTSSANLTYNNTVYPMALMSSNSTTATYSYRVTAPNVGTTSNVAFFVSYKINGNNYTSLTYSQEVRTVSNFIENSQTYNLSTYEGLTEGYNVNITYNNTYYTSVSGYLNFNGTNYTATVVNGGNNTLLRVSRVVPLVSQKQNRTFYWVVSFSNNAVTTTFTSNQNNQTLDKIAFGLCNATLTVPYLNLTFKDEKTSAVMNASILMSGNYYLRDSSVYRTFYFENTTDNNNYAFCFSPSNYQVTLSGMQVSYQKIATHPIRVANLDDTYVNSTTTRVLYLLDTSSGVNQVIQTLTNFGTALSGVLIVVTKDVGGVQTEVGRATTDSGGIAGFWLYPSISHTLTVSKAGFGTQTYTITPSGTPYTIQLGNSSRVAMNNFTLDGITWEIYPSSGNLINFNGATNFSFYVLARKSNLVSQYCKAELYDSVTNTVLDYTIGGNESTCNLTISKIIPADSRVFGRLYISENSGTWNLIEGDAEWFRLETNTTSAWTTVKSFFEEFGRIPELGTGMRNEFNRVIIFFFLLMLLMGILSFYTQFDTVYPGALILLVLVIIGIASYGNFLTLEFGNSNMTNMVEQYGLFGITCMLSIGYAFHQIARSML